MLVALALAPGVTLASEPEASQAAAPSRFVPDDALFGAVPKPEDSTRVLPVVDPGN